MSLVLDSFRMNQPAAQLGINKFPQFISPSSKFFAYLGTGISVPDNNGVITTTLTGPTQDIGINTRLGSGGSFLYSEKIASPMIYRIFNRQEIISAVAQNRAAVGESLLYPTGSDSSQYERLGFLDISPTIDDYAFVSLSNNSNQTVIQYEGTSDPSLLKRLSFKTRYITSNYALDNYNLRYSFVSNRPWDSTVSTFNLLTVAGMPSLSSSTFCQPNEHRGVSQSPPPACVFSSDYSKFIRIRPTSISGGITASNVEIITYNESVVDPQTNSGVCGMSEDEKVWLVYKFDSSTYKVKFSPNFGGEWVDLPTTVTRNSIPSLDELYNTIKVSKFGEVVVFSTNLNSNNVGFASVNYGY